MYVNLFEKNVVPSRILKSSTCIMDIKFAKNCLLRICPNFEKKNQNLFIKNIQQEASFCSKKNQKNWRHCETAHVGYAITPALGGGNNILYN